MTPDETTEKPEVTRAGVFSVQVCVPASYSDAEATDFAERAFPCGAFNGWSIRKEGCSELAGDPERAPCEERPGFVHITLDC